MSMVTSSRSDPDPVAAACVLEDRWLRDGVSGVTLTLNRAAQRNPLDHETVRALLDAVRRLRESAEVRAVIITGNELAFSAGGDLRRYLDLYRRPDDFRRYLDDFAALCDELERGPLVTCAMVGGVCVAGGLELTLACDVVVAASGVRIGDGHLATGQLPGAGGSQRLVRAIGVQRAKALLLSGRLISAEEAFVAGLVHHVFPAGELIDRTRAVAAEMATSSPLAYAHMKELIQLAQDTDRTAALAAERELVWRYATTSHDAREGLQSFLERRPARYTGD